MAKLLKWRVACMCVNSVFLLYTAVLWQHQQQFCPWLFEQQGLYDCAQSVVRWGAGAGHPIEGCKGPPAGLSGLLPSWFNMVSCQFGECYCPCCSKAAVPLGKVAVVNLIGCASVFCLLHLQRVFTAAKSVFVTLQIGRIACGFFAMTRLILFFWGVM